MQVIDAIFSLNITTPCSVAGCKRDTSRPIVRLPEIRPEHWLGRENPGVVGILICEKHSYEISDACTDARHQQEEAADPILRKERHG